MTDEVTSSGEPSLAHFVERLPVIVFRLDRQLRLIYVNQAVTRILGPDPASLIGRTALEAGVNAEQWAPFEHACQRVYATGEQQEADFIAKTAQGTRYFEAHLFPEMDAEGKVQSII